MGVSIQYSDTMIKPGLERIKFFLNKLGNPQNKFTSILVGGTNGKGSTVSFLYHGLEAAGVRAGAYLSPHIYNLEERVLLPRWQPEDLTSVMLEMEKRSYQWGIELSPFEKLTASVFVLFNNYKIDIAVLEVGMGGRWDATNVTDPEASVIVNLGIDHTRYLGNDLVSIAREKFPIARKGRPLVMGNIPLEGLRELRRRAESLGPLVHEWGRDFFSVGAGHESFYYLGEGISSSLSLRMGGHHQWINASLALRTLEVMGFPLNQRVLEGIQESWLPGRMQIEEVEGVPVVLDVAHNPTALAALLDALKFRFRDRPLWAFLKLLRDKPWQEYLKRALKEFERVYALATPAPDEREVPRTRLFGVLSTKPEDLMVVLEEAKKEGAILVFTGSFRSVREGMEWVVGNGSRWEKGSSS